MTLSRSPGVRLAGSLVSDGAGNCSGLEDLISDGAELFGRGFWFPTERGTVLIGAFDFQRSGGAILLMAFGVGRSSPLHPLGGWDGRISIFSNEYEFIGNGGIKNGTCACLCNGSEDV